jgi:hypothetical protein
MRRSVPIDVFQCGDCNAPMAEEDWVAPVMPLLPSSCMNCGERREHGVCGSCGLTRQEDLQVHEELRQVVGAGTTLLAAAREASKQGRRLMALKLATAAAGTNEQGEGDVARALRVWLLAAIGENLSALEDGKAWVENHTDPPALAWASVGQQYQQQGFPGAAADAYAKSLQKDPRQQVIRARRAQLLLQMSRDGQAFEEAGQVFDLGGDQQAVATALGVYEQMAERFEKDLREEEVERLIKRAGVWVNQSAKMLVHRARISALANDLAAAKTDLKAARALDETVDITRVEVLVRPQRSSWWRW